MRLIVLLALCACQSTTTGTLGVGSTCATTSQCAAGLACVNGQCGGAGGDGSAGCTDCTTQHGSFTLSVSPLALTVAKGEQIDATLTLTRDATLSGAISVDTSGEPVGVTATITPLSLTTGTITFAADAGAADGTAMITVTATAGAITQTAVVALTVVTKPTVVSLQINDGANEPAVGIKALVGGQAVTTDGAGKASVTLPSGLPYDLAVLAPSGVYNKKQLVIYGQLTRTDPTLQIADTVKGPVIYYQNQPLTGGGPSGRTMGLTANGGSQSNTWSTTYDDNETLGVQPATGDMISTTLYALRSDNAGNLSAGAQVASFAYAGSGASMANYVNPASAPYHLSFSTTLTPAPTGRVSASVHVDPSLSLTSANVEMGVSSAANSVVNPFTCTVPAGPSGHYALSVPVASVTALSSWLLVKAVGPGPASTRSTSTSSIPLPDFSPLDASLVSPATLTAPADMADVKANSTFTWESAGSGLDALVVVFGSTYDYVLGSSLLVVCYTGTGSCSLPDVSSLDPAFAIPSVGGQWGVQSTTEMSGVEALLEGADPHFYNLFAHAPVYRTETMNQTISAIRTFQ